MDGENGSGHVVAARLLGAEAAARPWEAVRPREVVTAASLWEAVEAARPMEEVEAARPMEEVAAAVAAILNDEVGCFFSKVQLVPSPQLNRIN